ncbi:MAG TPA: MFS transporter [Acetobacteraceae bacterium]|jgi:MFS family permease
MSEITAGSRVAPRSEFQQGWPVVLACFCTATFAWGFGFYGQSVYFAGLHTMRGWPVSLIASATTVYYLVGGLLLLPIHRVFARLGPRWLLAGGAATLGVGAIGLTHAGLSWQLYVWAVVMAAGWAATTTTALATTLALWFDQRRGLALSLALLGASAGGFTITPLLAALAEHLGLGRAVALSVMVALAVLLPVIFAGIPRRALPLRPLPAGEWAPSTSGRPAFAGQRDALRSVQVWSIATPFALALAAQVGFIVHQVSYLMPQLGAAGAARAVAATAVAAAAGRLAIAPLIDRINQRLAAAASFLVQAAGLALMLALPDQPVALYAGSIVFGLSVGNVVTLPALIVQHEFAAQSFGLVIGLVSMVGYTALAFGPTLLGLARDVAESYSVAIVLCIVLQLAGALLLLMRKPRMPRLFAPRG